MTQHNTKFTTHSVSEGTPLVGKSIAGQFVLALISGLTLRFFTASLLIISSSVLVAAQDVPPTEKKTQQHVKTETPFAWNQWRGPQRDSLVSGLEIPEKLNLNLAWESETLRPSYSGPVTNGETLFTTETVDRKQEITSGFDLKTGKRVWQTKWDGAMLVPFFAASNGSWIRSTPACDQDSVYVVGIQDVLMCLDAKSGEQRWKVNFGEKYSTGNPPFGAVCSPLLDGEFLYLQAANRLFKLKKQDGAVVWQSMEEPAGMSTGGSFSSPYMTTLNGKRQLLVQSRTQLAGVDPDSGQVLWRVEVPNFRGMNILTPTTWNDCVFTSSYNNQSFLYDSKETQKVRTVWQNAAKGYMASPVIIGDHAYLLLQNGRMACMDLRSGERTWTSEKKIGDYVSCVSDGKKILLLSDDGHLYLLKENSEFMDLVADQQLPGVKNSWAHIGIGPAADANAKLQVYVRSLDKLQVYNWE